MNRRTAKITGEENLKKAFEDLFSVMLNIRKYTLEWENRYGVETKLRKKFWEDKADKLLADLENGEYTPLVTSKRRADEEQRKLKNLE